MPGTPEYRPAENLASAIARGDESTFRALLAKHPDPDNIPDFPYATLLHFAVMQGRSWAVEEVLKKGADPNRLTPTHKTALDLAEEHDWRPLPMIVDMLTKAGGKRYDELPEVVAAKKLAVLRERAKTANPKVKF
ncbi:MAG: ankyrin repeat domain-containing protein [Alphaproteobacteria bacterium]|nr:MAG: ankyrin repeat domain-containing protein [Alphaproteobacteria bacterium]